MMVAKQIKGHYLPINDNNIDNQSTVLCDNSMENLNKLIVNTSYGPTIMFDSFVNKLI